MSESSTRCPAGGEDVASPTPGEWKASPDGSQMVITASFVTIARTYTAAREFRANTRLIVAAKDLLEACIQARAAMPDPTFAETPELAAVINLISAAIAKAKGGTEPQAATAEAHGVDVEITTSELDGTPVVQIDTPDVAEDGGGPMVRVYLNDGTLYENPSYAKATDEA